MMERRCEDALSPAISGMSRSAASRSDGKESMAVMDSQSESGLPRSRICLSARKPWMGLGSREIWLPFRLRTSSAGSSESGATASHKRIALSSTHSTASLDRRDASKTLPSEGANDVTPLAPKCKEVSSGIAEASSRNWSHAMPVRLRHRERMRPSAEAKSLGSVDNGESGSRLSPSQVSRGSCAAMSSTGRHSEIGLPSRSSSSIAPHTDAISPAAPASVTFASGKKTCVSR
mmetsp:Transcript_28166/g.89730  ORF Transcript_28166/g.89730 Transcript_28166/m.89730 type:complete len:233 (-) Transcript_28166:113-811(-)